MTVHQNIFADYFQNFVDFVHQNEDDVCKLQIDGDYDDDQIDDVFQNYGDFGDQNQDMEVLVTCLDDSFDG